MLALRRGHGGFTLIETMAAIVVFFIVTIGVLPLISSSIRGSSLARSLTLGKSVGEQAMERVRGLPYHNSRTTQRLDVLDFYYPSATGAGYSAGTYTVVCASGSTDPACPRPIPSGYTVTFNSAFVRAVGTTSPETYEIVLPADTYAWNAAGGANRPPATAQYLRVGIVTNWQVNDDGRSFTMTTLLSDRKTGSLTIDGVAEIDHFLQVLTSFNVAGSRSDLTVTAGTAESRVEARQLTTADQVVTSARSRLADSNNPRQFADVEVVGELGSANAPPDTATGTVVQPVPVDQTLVHPQLPAGTGAVSDFSDTVVSGLTAQQALGLPSASGQLSFANDDPVFLVNNQADTTNGAEANLPSLLLAPTGRVVWVSSPAGPTIFGQTQAVSTGPGVPRKVQTTAVLQGTSAGTGAAAVNLLPAQFIPGNGPVVEISNFTARVDCPSTGLAGTVPVAEWSASLRYWRETAGFDNFSEGRYVEVVTDLGTPLNGSPSSGTPRVDPLAALTADPPMVHEVVDPDDPTTLSPIGSERDIYLFPTTHTHADADGDGDETGDEGEADAPVVHSHPGYLSDWSSLGDTTTTKDVAGRSTSARIDGAITISTTATNPAIPASALNVSVGSLSCYALDRRL